VGRHIFEKSKKQDKDKMIMVPPPTLFPQSPFHLSKRHSWGSNGNERVSPRLEGAMMSASIRERTAVSLARLGSLDLQRNFSLEDSRPRNTSELAHQMMRMEYMQRLQNRRTLANLSGVDPHQTIVMPRSQYHQSHKGGPSDWVQNLLAASQQPRQLIGPSPFAFHNQQLAAERTARIDLLRTSVASTQLVESCNEAAASFAEANPATTSTTGANISNNGYFIQEIREWDVLCGRGGRSNHHPGNKRYRQVVSEMKASYRNIEAKSAKTDLSKAILDHVYSYGGRFIKQDRATGRAYVLTVAESRKKTSQALRETKELKWTL
jgi:hypothetical protein